MVIVEDNGKVPSNAFMIQSVTVKLSKVVILTAIG